MLKKIVAVTFFGVLPLALGYFGLAEGASGGPLLRTMLHACSVSPLAADLIVAFSGPIGGALLLLATLLLFRSADVRDNGDGTATISGVGRRPYGAFAIRPIVPGLAILEVGGVKLFTFGAERKREG